MRDVMELAVIGVEAVTIRSVAGHGDQAELVVKTKRGALTLRLISSDRVIRVTDLRKRDKAKRRPLLSVPFDEVQR